MGGSDDVVMLWCSEDGVMMGKIVFDDDPDNQPEARYEGINYVDKVSCKEVIRYIE